MPKNNEIEQLVNGSVADANIVNQIVLNAGNEEDAIPYDEDDHQRDPLGSQSLGSVAYPWGNLCLSRDGYLFEVETTSNTVANQVAIKNLRKFLSLKDCPTTFVGQALKKIRCNAAETALEFSVASNFEILTSGTGATWNVPAGVSKVYASMCGGGGGGGGSNGPEVGSGGGGGASGIMIPYTVTPSGTVTYTVGAGGTAGTAGINGTGGTGATTSFGTLSALGGAGGDSNSTPSPGGAGGAVTSMVGTAGSASTPGKAGGSQTGTFIAGGTGGAAANGDYGGAGGGGTAFGIGGAGGTGGASATNGVAGAANTGAGGGGAGGKTGDARTGGAGGSGVIILIY